jgi:hypothetical protein
LGTITTAAFDLSHGFADSGWQGARRDSKTFVVVDEDCGIPVSLVESYRSYEGVGPLALSDPRSVLLSMSDYPQKQHYDDVYGESVIPALQLITTVMPEDRRLNSEAPSSNLNTFGHVEAGSMSR